MDKGPVGQGRDIPGLGMGSTEGNVALTSLQCSRMQKKALSICSSESNVLTQGRVFAAFFSS